MITPADRPAVLSWGAWLSDPAGDGEPRVLVLPCSITSLRRWGDRWKLTLGETEVDVEERFALMVLAAHR